MVVKISFQEQQKLSGLKELDIQSCQEEHVLCPSLCLKVARNIFDCWLYMELPRVKPIEVVKPNRSYDKASCYLCSKELEGASKKGVVKNRNNPSF
ncbi:34997_t:CDS:2 [Gigaspora margarita]|uniref:34997_t:CDS:1 n=1 Tax=Gigaspora margarita TaxID=4874 RepID=A0ABN7WFJ9_GIGMA|nr:34997_t:CDS:2 [Gigaspora margarita]